ncbi:serine/threonine-protein kinase [Rubripirellula lacrimiformis]|nr:serine/threonine-protein kinase [Rubripirellula lacrimiformis]
MPAASSQANSDGDSQVGDLREQRLANLLSEITDAICQGQILDIDQVCQANPDLAGELRRLLGTVLVTDTAGAKRDEGLADQNPAGNRWRSLRLPSVVGDYELIEELGRGGMGVVFRARQISLDREVAVKMILRGRLASDLDLHRFMAEASATAKLEHAGIVPVFEVDDVDGRPFFSMQLVDGMTLAEAVADGPLPQRRAAKLVAEVARAIGYANRHGVLHRDLKPSNILIASDGSAMVTDFGLAKQISEADDLTRSGMLLGTPAYMSPEQAGGRRGLMGPASDVYSLGAVLYFALTGQPPFVASSPMELVMLVIEQDPVPPRGRCPSLDRDLEMIVIRCLQKPIDLRYQSADDLAADLEAYLADEKVSARSGQFNQVVARLFRETHHSAVLENWGTLWIWHSLVLLVACMLTWQLEYHDVQQRWVYATVWIVGLGAWASVFWSMRQRMGPVTFIERQVAHVWGASMIAIGSLFPLEWWLQMPVLSLSPMLGVISAMVFIIKASMFSGAFYLQAAALLAVSLVMAIHPDFAHFWFGIVAAACFFIPGFKYARQRHAAPTTDLP